MKIAMLGTRGVPASYGGFERCAEELGVRLVERGHQVTVYCRSHHADYSEPYYRGIRRIRLSTIRHKYLETITHVTLSAFHAMTQDYDVILMFIAGTSPVALLPRLAGQQVAINVDGLDWKRRKWSAFAKKYIQLAEWLSNKAANAVITDSRRVQEYYRERYNAETTYIAYGADVQPAPPGPFLKQFGLQPRRYVLFVGRLVPDNCAHHLVGAFEGLETDMCCVIVGSAPYADKYIQQLQASAPRKVIFTGYLFGDGYRELSSHPYAFVETSEVGGTHPALLEAMAFGNCVIVNNTRENIETIADTGLVYDGHVGASSLREALRGVLANPERVEDYRRRAQERAIRNFTWEGVTDEYEALFRRLCTKRVPVS